MMIGNVDGDRSLSGQWAVFIQFTVLDNTPPVRGEIDEDSSVVQAEGPEIWSGMSKKSQQKEKQHWAEEEPKLDNARKPRGFYYVDPDDKEFNETLKSAPKKVWMCICTLQCRVNRERPQGNTSLKAPEDPQEKTRDELWQGEIVSNHQHKKKRQNGLRIPSHELTRKRIPETQNKDHEDHTAERDGSIV